MKCIRLIVALLLIPTNILDYDWALNLYEIQKSGTFYMKGFCIFFFTFFAHTRLFFRFFHALYFHPLHDGACIFTPYMVVCVFACPLV